MVQERLDSWDGIKTATSQPISDEPILVARRRGARGIGLDNSDFQTLIDEFQLQEKEENGR